jgi:hypothetical protein
MNISDVRCLMCSRIIGQIADGKFVHDSACTLPLRISGGHLRCCRCGGSLYLEPAGFAEPERAGVKPAPPVRIKRA